MEHLLGTFKGQQTAHDGGFHVIATSQYSKFLGTVLAVVLCHGS